MIRISRMAFFSIFLLICMACGLSVSAQESYVTISGTVRDIVGKTLALCKRLCTRPALFSTVTNADGRSSS